MKFEVLYDTRIALANYKKGDEMEFAKGTDELFIKRLINIGCIKPIQTDEAKTADKADKRGVKLTKPEANKTENKGKPKSKATVTQTHDEADADEIDVSDIDYE